MKNEHTEAKPTATPEAAASAAPAPKLRGTALSSGVQGCSVDELSAVARLTGAVIIDAANCGRLRRPSVKELLGNARTVVAEIHRTTITQ